MSRKIFPQFQEIKRLREQEGWSQGWVALAADVSTRTYQRIEAGEGCSIETLKSIASVFDVNFKMLLPPPKTNEQYVPSWFALIFVGAKRLIVYPAIFAVLVVSIASSAVLLSYGLHKAEIVTSQFWTPLTDEEKEARDENRRYWQEQYNQKLIAEGKSVKPAFFREKPAAEREKFRAFLFFVLVLSFLPWVFAFAFNMQKLSYQRDFKLLVADPVSRYFQKLGKSIEHLVFGRVGPA